MRELHERICDLHTGGRSQVTKAVEASYYWDHCQRPQELSNVEVKLYGESKVIQRSFDDNNDDDKGDDKKLKDQSKNN